MSPAEFSREIEAYLCRKNDGHLIRIVGPVFEKVCGWAARGVPLRVAFQGIDRYFERRQAKGPAANRRPARVEFCEPDVLDAFDAWRRAVGVVPGMASDEGFADSGSGFGSDSGAGSGSGAGAGSGSNARAVAGDRGVSAGADSAAWAHAGAHASTTQADETAHGATAEGGDSASERSAASRRKTGLQTHIDRVMARLTQRRVESGLSSALGEAIDRLLAELDALRAGAKGARQEARVELEMRLRTLDDTFVSAARAAVDANLWQTAARDARDELEPFRARMAPAAYESALQAATARSFRTLARLPTVAVED